MEYTQESTERCLQMGAKMKEQKDPELTCSHDHTKITTIFRTIISGKDQTLSEKIFYNLRSKEGPTMRCIGGADSIINSYNHRLENNCSAEDLPQEWVF